jgi:hypothetical protein
MNASSVVTAMHLASINAACPAVASDMNPEVGKGRRHMKSYWIAGAAISIVAATFAVSLTSESGWAQSTPYHPADILSRLAPKPSVTLVACRWGTWQGCMFTD